MRQKYLPLFVLFGVTVGGMCEYISRKFIVDRPRGIENITVKPALLPQDEFVVEPAPVVTSKTVSIKGGKHLKNVLYFFKKKQILEFERLLKKVNIRPRDGHKLFFSIKQKGGFQELETLQYYLKDYYLEVKLQDNKFTATKCSLKKQMKVFTLGEIWTSEGDDAIAGND